jgi:hypothetical protein
MSIVFTKLDKTSSTKSVILSRMREAPKEFIDWLKKEMEVRNWGIRETAIKVGVSHPTISDIVTNGRLPSFETVGAPLRRRTFTLDFSTQMRAWTRKK